MEYEELNNGVKMPILGLGTYTLHGDEINTAVSAALDFGYRLFDTAYKYKNEEELRDVLKQKNIKRDELFIVSKICQEQLTRHRRYLYLDGILKSGYSQSLKRLGFKYLDMYLLHGWYNVDHAYSQLVELYKKGKVRSIGVCNLNVKTLKRLIDNTGFVPQLCQFQCQPFYTKKD